MTETVTILVNNEPHTVPRRITPLQLKRACGIPSADVVYVLPLIVEVPDDVEINLDEGDAFATTAPPGVGA